MQINGQQQRPTVSQNVRLIGYSPWSSMLLGHTSGRVGMIVADDKSMRPTIASDSDGPYTIDVQLGPALEDVATSRVRPSGLRRSGASRGRSCSFCCGPSCTSR